MYKKLKEIAKTEEQKKIIKKFEETKPTEKQKECFATLVLFLKSINTIETDIKTIEKQEKEIKGARNEKNDK